VLKKTITFVICLCILMESMPLTVLAKDSFIENTHDSINEEIIDSDILDLSSITAVSPNNVNDMLAQSRFSSRTGHGFAAERGNNLADKIKGKNTRVVGDNNIKNGADRLIINRDGTRIYIQDKYYADAKSSINACFDDSGAFRYVDGDGNPMLIEVPSDQYAEAVECMKAKIIEGKIPGITDPEEANTLVKKGALSYKQARNLAKAGTIESLTYDSVNGTVNATCAFGISALINYTVLRINGEERGDAVKGAAEEGFKTGVVVFGTSIVAGQLSKTGAMKVFEPSSEALVKLLGDDFAKALIKSTGEKVVETGAESATQSLTKNAARVLRSQALVAALTTVAFSVPDAVDMFRGRISKQQFVKNFAVTAVAVVGGLAGDVAGAAIGELLVPGVGAVPGAIVMSIISGTVSGLVADKISDYIVDDDAYEMYDIIQDKFAQLCDDYIINEYEANNIVDALSDRLDDDAFKDMYQSKDRQAYAEQLLMPLFENEVAKREGIDAPSEEEMREALLEQLDGIVYIH